MREQIISFKTAKLAKKKGFDDSVYGAHIHRQQELFYTNNGRKVDYDFVIDFDDKDNYLRNINHLYPAPTQTLLQKWLREVHQIYIEIDVDCTSSPKFLFNIKKFKGNPKNLAEKEWNWITLPHTHFFLERSYEEALETGLQKALKLI